MGSRAGSKGGLPVVLVSGFEPFGADSTNPSAEIARRLDGRQVGDAAHPQARVRGIELPCVFGMALDHLLAAVERERPVVVIALGLAASRHDISVERVAINIDDARIPDNAGCQPIDRPVRAGGPVAWWSTLPVKGIVAAIRGAGIAASVSQTAGTFVCNHVFYGLADHVAALPAPRPRAGFMHVPWPADDADGIGLDAMTEAVRIAIVTSLCHEGPDLQRAEGAVD